MGAEAECQAPAAAAAAGRAEIDTSAPFESVREAVDRFGGSAAWSSHLIKCMFATPNPKKQELSEETGQVVNVEEQTAQIENELFNKERETLDVLKELELTKKIIADLKLKIRAEETDTSPTAEKSDEGTEVLLAESIEEQSESIIMDEGHLQHPSPSASALLEFDLVKENLDRTTGDLAAIRATVELLRDSIGRERTLLESGREKLSSNAALISSLEDELDQTSQKLQTLKDLQTRREHPSDIFIEIKKMASEVRQLRSMANASKSEAVMLTAEIEQAKASIGTAEARCIAAKKMEEAARAAEALALADIKALLSSESSSEGSSSVSDGVTLSVEEYAMMYSKAQEADNNSRKKVQEVMLQVDEANASESDSVRNLEDAKQDVEECMKALQEALERVEAANHGKLAVEDIVRRWRCESGHKRRSIGGSPKFKKAGHHRKHSHSMDMVSDISSSSSFKPTLSIGQILSMKLTGPDGYDKSVWDDKTGELPVVSLGQIINRKSGILCTEDMAEPKRIAGKRKKFALAGLSVLLAKQSKSKKKRESL